MTTTCRFVFALLVVLCILASGCSGNASDAASALWEAFEPADNLCDFAAQEIMNEDRATVVEESPSRLHATWISQDCEIRTGPEFVIRKYNFFENGTFLLMRHYYAEESCSIATHTVTARGVIKILGNSLVTPGASETRYQLDTVHVSPLNRQVAHKLGHRVNVSCGPQPRWRPYLAQLIYERAPERFGPGGSLTWQSPRYNSLQGHHGSSSHHGSSGLPRGSYSKSVDCLAPLNIDFDELRLLRVQRRPTGFRSASFGTNDRPRVELFLGSLPAEMSAKRSHRPTSLQPTSLLRTDTIQNCPICNSIIRGTENSPPLLHEVVALPALIGGSWISPVCESHPGGVWLRRQLRVYAGDKLWTGRWDFFNDARCTSFLYGITAAGSYVQRARRHRRHDAVDDEEDLIEDEVLFRAKRQTAEQKQKRIKNLFGKKSLSPRAKKELAEWMTPELAKDLFDIYAPAKIKKHQMVPTSDEITEAMGNKNAKNEKIVEKSVKQIQEIGDNSMQSRPKRAVDEIDYYRHLLQSAQPSMAESFAAMLRGNQRREETTKRPLHSPAPTGTTELDLHVAESLLIAGDLTLAKRCGANVPDGDNPKAPRLSNWPSSCVPHSLDAPSTLGLRARIVVDWYGQYNLLLGDRESNLWDAALIQCGPTSMKNPLLRSHLRRSVGLRYGILFNSSTRNYTTLGLVAMMIWQFVLVRWFGSYVTR